MEAPKVLTISDLLQQSRPLTGAASLHSSLPSLPPILSIPSSSSSSRKQQTPNPNPNPRLLPPLDHPAIIIGTLTLASPDQSSPSDRSGSCSRNHCFSFSDASSSICCDVLELDVRIIGRKIHVLAWNYIPFKCGGGFLEIIRWGSPESISGLTRCLNLRSLPLTLDSYSVCKDSLKARYSVYGLLESISPVSVVPCTIGVSNLQGRPDTNSGDPRNLLGFLAQIRICECRLCKLKDSSIDLIDNVGGHNSHSFTHSAFIYFSGSASSWHPMISKLVGNILSLSGLKKKLIFMGKEESDLIYVTTEKSLLHISKLSSIRLSFKKTDIVGKGELSDYTGIVKGIYVQGMLVELDEEVWLLLTDELLTAPHSLRVGALVSVKNAHFVNPLFSWTKMLILGACHRTSIVVESYSPKESRCHMVSQSQSLLGKFIGSLAFAARVWVLLVIVCLRKKFSGILSDKEILGSKHREGLAQVYASSHLSSSVFQSRHGVFKEFCKHGLCGCCNESGFDELKLVVPILNFLHHCETTWTRAQLQLENDSRISSYKNQHSPRSCNCKGRSYSQSIRRVFSSEDTGFVLLGSLKISPYSGRLQLTDATGSIDVVIPGLPSTWDVDGFYEVKDYSIVMEAIPEESEHLELLDNQPFSCRSIFHSVPMTRVTNLAVYVYFNWRNAVCRNLSLHHFKDWKVDFREIENGRFHLLCVTHKYPVLQKFQGENVISNRSSLFVEAIILPWDLFLCGKNEGTLPTKISKDELEKPMERNTCKIYQDYVSYKRCRMDHASSGELSSGFVDYSSVAGEGSCCDQNDYFSISRKFNQEWRTCSSSLLEISCLAVISGIDDSLFSSGILYYKKANANGGVGAQKVLLEFNSDSFFKFQFLQIGGFYIAEHQEDEIFCKLNGSYNVGDGKVRVTSGTCLWSLSFFSDGGFPNTDPLHGHSFCDICISNIRVLSGGSVQTELPFQQSTGKILKTSSDICLQLSANAMRLFELDLKALVEDLTKPCVKQEQASNVSLCGVTLMNVSARPFGTADSGCMLPKGNLISLHGHVVAVHSFDGSSLDGQLEFGEVNQLRFFQELTSICIHIGVDNYIVRISGALSKSAYPVGFGPGVRATFHRILESRMNFH
ncbi:CST complex subunit CTC1 isoform X2 [Malania oleifera]|uniref:CST complex subunit CTC1 isoform X2 n=2 Tax=Malania oleifera TaxID=397392 RepID=UPI0025ADA9D4|nr:CST complex subunit CTC1 isoform X2 [Malania oleifera]